MVEVAYIYVTKKIVEVGNETAAGSLFLWVLSSCGNGQLLKLFPPSWNNGELVFNLFPTGIIMNDRHDLAKLAGESFKKMIIIILTSDCPWALQNFA